MTDRSASPEAGPLCRPPRALDRRSALGLVVAGAICAVATPARLLGRRPSGAGDVLVALLDEVPPGSATTSSYHGLPILVVNGEDGVLVLSALCTHEGCTVEWNGARREIACPCHGGLFGPSGEVREGPPPSPLIRFPVRVADGKIFVVEDEAGAARTPPAPSPIPARE